MKKLKIIIAVMCMFTNLISLSLAANAATYKYDSLGRVVEIVYDSGQKLTYTYDAAGNILSIKIESPDGVIKGIVLDSKSYSLNLGNAHNTVVKADFANGIQRNITVGVEFTTSNSDIAAVDRYGKVTALKIGEATITANYEGYSASVKVSVVSPTDTEAPTQPKNLTVTEKTDTTLSVSWTASTDNVAVEGYEIYINDIKTDTSTKTTYTFTGIEPGKEYSIYVKAFDTAGNCSLKSNIILEKTSIKYLDIDDDGAISFNDIMIIASAFNSKSGDGRYDLKCDLNTDGAVNMQDVMMLAAHFNKLAV
jgi:YD repeat-containing protein